MKNDFDVTAVINLHREGQLAKRTIASVLNSIEYARSAGVSSEILIILDSPDSCTVEIAENYRGLARLQIVDFRSLSEARNYAVREARGDFIGFIDGDDLWGKKWIQSAFHLAKSLDHGQYIIHPKLNIYFGRGVVPESFVHPDMRYEKVDMFDIISANKWTALSFADRRIYQMYNFPPIDLQNGFGYEDWAWNFKTMRKGFLHITAEDGVHFIRRKKSGSMLIEAELQSAIPLLSPIIY